MYYELVNRALRVGRQNPLPLVYGNVRLDCSYRMDLVVEDSVVIEVKSVAKLDRVRLKISGLHLGVIINFNVRNLSREGIRRKVNAFPE